MVPIRSAEGVKRLWRAAVGLWVSDDPETGMVIRVVATGIVLWGLLTGAPEHASVWVWAALGASLTCWLVFAVGDRAAPRTALACLALSTVLAAAVVGPAGGAATIPVFVGMGTYALHLRPSVRSVLALFAVEVAIALVSLWPAEQRVEPLLLHAALQTVVLLFGLRRRQYRLQALQTERLLEQTRAAQQERERSAALDERARIARDLHDVLAHSLGALGVQLDVAESLLARGGDVEGAADRVRRSRAMAAEGLREARTVIAALRADPPASLPESIEAIAAAHRGGHGVRVDVDVTGAPRPLRPAAELALSGTAREALTNAARHAPGAPTRVVLAYTDAGARLTVGNGPAERPGAVAGGGGGFGLAGMAERLAAVGGTLRAGPLGDGPDEGGPDGDGAADGASGGGRSEGGAEAADQRGAVSREWRVVAEVPE
ncbi:sensor histidine kinase [Nocardiopsis suaedae]|uniref:histidine kinase n=1 Tax=Nocardiopsis suaedae TaxID=3018444 RepID=A0ABT4TN48_9ACTN|nr:histidine kinase [Nocardiopsis suaedae]MDA2805669.1 histidine kinase [Nocardiopsis suaedae]